MKAFVIIMMSLLISQYALSQSCDDCKDKKFQYYFCKDGKGERICSSNPLNESDLKFHKECLPPQINYTSSQLLQYYPFGTWGYDYDNNGQIDRSENYFDASDARNEVDESLNEWLALCSPIPINNKDCNPCPLNIIWSSDSRDFIAFPDALATTKYEYNPDCSIKCDHQVVYINIDQETTGWVPLSSTFYFQIPTKRFFYTNPNHKKTPKGMPLYSMKTTLQHEIGHWLGFGHQDNKCGDVNGIMTINPLKPATEWAISYDDRCMFMKVYCCEPSLVKEPSEREISVKIFPNPTNINAINIQINNPSSELINFEIVTIIGTSILTGEILPNENPKTISLNNASSGVYYIILKHNGQQEVVQFIINK